MAAAVLRITLSTRPRTRDLGNQKQKKNRACKLQHQTFTYEQYRIIDNYGNNYPQLVKACELASLPPPPPLPVRPPPSSRNDKKYNQPCSRCQLYESFSAILNYHNSLLLEEGGSNLLLLLPTKEPPLKDYLLQIDSKRRSSREECFSSLVDALTHGPHHQFVDGYFLTMVHDHCLPRLTTKKKGSSNFSKREIRLAVRLISLVSINLVSLDYAHQVYELCVPILSDALISFSACDDWDTVLDILDCLAIVGFFGSSYSRETEKVMRLVWEFLITAEDDDDQNNPRPQLVTASAITAWSCLLTTIKFNTWNLTNTCYWTGFVSYFSQLLKENHHHESLVLAAADDALALISQLNSVQKFSYLDDDDDDDDLSQSIPLKFIKRFLGGEGFTNHMEQNENFREFTFTTSAENTLTLDEEEEPERDEAIVKFYRPQVERQKTDDSDPLQFVSEREKKIQKRMIKSPSSLLNKARTKLLNKQQQFKNNAIYCDNQSDDDC